MMSLLVRTQHDINQTADFIYVQIDQDVANWLLDLRQKLIDFPPAPHPSFKQINIEIEVQGKIRGWWMQGKLEDIPVIQASSEDDYCILPEDFNYRFGDRITQVHPSWVALRIQDTGIFWMAGYGPNHTDSHDESWGIPLDLLETIAGLNAPKVKP